MKRIAVLICSVLIMSSSCVLNAQIRKIPASVTEAFKVKYPEAKNVEFKDKLTSYLVQFELNGASHEAKYSNKGEWEQTEKTISESDLPPSVKDGLSKSKFSEWEISSVAWIQYKDGHIEYRILVKKSTLEKKYLYFNEAGKLLRDTITL